MKQRMIISLEPKQMATLKRLATERSRSVSSLVRNAVSDYTQGEKKTPAANLLEHLRVFEKKHKHAFKDVDPNLSQNIDKLLYGK